MSNNISPIRLPIYLLRQLGQIAFTTENASWAVCRIDACGPAAPRRAGVVLAVAAVVCLSAIDSFVPFHRLGGLLPGSRLHAQATQATSTVPATQATQKPSLRAAFGEADITPSLEQEGPVWLAGYGPGRQATAVHDPIMARCVVLEAHQGGQANNEDNGDDKDTNAADGEAPVRVAILSVDLIGMQLPEVQRVRAALPSFQHVAISSTHNHEGPDVIGLWGASVVSRGVHDAYVQRMVAALISLVRDTASELAPVEKTHFGYAQSDALLRDSRKPEAKDGVLRVLRFEGRGRKRLGEIVQWNCHPEAMGSKNKELTADFVGVTVAELERRWKSPVVLISGAVGGLMAPPNSFPGYQRGDESRWDYMTAYGKAVADLAARADGAARPITLTPFAHVTRSIAVPIDNAYYRTAQAIGVLRRVQTVWMDDPWNVSVKPGPLNQLRPRALVTEVGWLRLGQLDIACVPGEIYPELVTGEFQDPVEPNVDFPDAPREPTIRQILGENRQRWMLFGLCNDEIGYLIPKSQWDQQAPFAYGRSKSQYGEINSCSVDAGPIIMRGMKETYEALGR